MTSRDPQRDRASRRLRLSLGTSLIAGGILLAPAMAPLFATPTVPGAAEPSTARVPASGHADDVALKPLSPDEQETFLKTADVVKAEPIGKGVTRPWRLTLRLGDRVQRAAFQSVNRSREDVRFRSGRFERRFRDFYGYNIAAYRLARLLGYDELVPPSVERMYRREIGALTWWVDKKWDEDERLKAGIEPPDRVAWERQVYLARVFTALVQDTDRNLGNQLVTADFRLWMIDFTRAFRHGPEVENPAILRRIDRQLLQALRTLPDRAYKDAIAEYLEPGGLDALLARRTAIVTHFDRIIAERGEANVVFD